MICPLVRIDLVRACTEETCELIKIEIGDSCSAVLVDEEQMAMVVTYISPLNFYISLVLYCCFQLTILSPFLLYVCQ